MIEAGKLNRKVTLQQKAAASPQRTSSGPHSNESSEFIRFRLSSASFQ